MRSLVGNDVYLDSEFDMTVSSVPLLLSSEIFSGWIRPMSVFRVLVSSIARLGTKKAASAIWMVRVVQLVPVSCRLIDILYVSAYFSTSLWFYAGGKLGVKSRCCRRLRSLGVFAKTDADHPEHSEDC